MTEQVERNMGSKFTNNHKIDISFRQLLNVHSLTGQAERNTGSLLTITITHRINVSFRKLTDIQITMENEKEIRDLYSPTNIRLTFHFDN